MNIETLKRYAVMTLGIFIATVSIQTFVVPTGISTGGVTGLAIVVHELTGINNSLTIWGFNAVFLLLTGLFVDKEIVVKSIYGTIVFSLFMSIIPSYDLTQGDKLLSMIAGGLLEGVGFGLVFLSRGSTGGTSLPPYILQKYFKLPLTTGFFLADIVSIGANIFTGSIINIAYGTIAVLCLKTSADYIQTGISRKKAVYVISPKHDEITKFIHETLNRGTTDIHATTGFLHNDAPILLSVLSTKEYIELEDYTLGIDPSAFIMVSTVSEMNGHGFSKEKIDLREKSI